jgi:hypothetical protein
MAFSRRFEEVLGTLILAALQSEQSGSFYLVVLLDSKSKPNNYALWFHGLSLVVDGVGKQAPN